MAAAEPIGGENIMATWIDQWDVDENCENGIGFLVRRENQNHPGCPSKHVLRARPQHTNQSYEPRLDGWCGTTDNIAYYAEGLARVSRKAKNGRVCLVAVKATPELLESLGWPGLA